MPVNDNYYIVWDLETSSADPYSCMPLEIACVAVHPKKLEIIEGSEFQSFIKPDTDENGNILWDKIEYGALAVGGKTHEQIEQYKKDIDNAPTRKEVFDNLCTYLNRYRVGKNQWGNPIPVGHNINNFDQIIMYRVMKEFNRVDKNGKQLLWHPLHAVDTLDLCFLWFENLGNPAKLNMDCLREFFGMKNDSGHRALYDTIQTAQLFIKFMNFYRKQAAKTKFQGAMREV